MAGMRMIEAVRAAIAEEMERDERVLVLGEDVGKKGGVFGATDGLYARFGESRVLDTPLAESGIVGVAIGAALNGLIPIAEIQFADVIRPAFDQIVSEAARTRYRSNGDWGVPIVIRTPFGGGVHGGLYHSQSIEAFYAHVPGLKVVVPSMPADAHGLLKSAIRDPDPVLFLEHKKVYRLVAEEVPDGDHLLPIGRAVVRRKGTELHCFAWPRLTCRRCPSTILRRSSSCPAPTRSPRRCASLPRTRTAGRPKAPPGTRQVPHISDEEYRRRRESVCAGMDAMKLDAMCVF